MKLNQYIDHTLLKQDATQKQIETLCQQAITYEFASVCVNPYYVSYCKSRLKFVRLSVFLWEVIPLQQKPLKRKMPF